jgi:hypothetical protein
MDHLALNNYHSLTRQDIGESKEPVFERFKGTCKNININGHGLFYCRGWIIER